MQGWLIIIILDEFRIAWSKMFKTGIMIVCRYNHYKFIKSSLNLDLEIDVWATKRSQVSPTVGTTSKKAGREGGSKWLPAPSELHTKQQWLQYGHHDRRHGTESGNVNWARFLHTPHHGEHPKPCTEYSLQCDEEHGILST